MTDAALKAPPPTPADDAWLAVLRFARQIWADRGHDGKPNGATIDEAYARFNAGERPRRIPAE